MNTWWIKAIRLKLKQELWQGCLMEFHCGQLRIPVRKHVFKRELNSPLILEVPGHSFRLLAFVGTDIIWSWIPDKSLWWDSQNFIPCANWFSLLSIDYREEGKLQGKGNKELNIQAPSHTRGTCYRIWEELVHKCEVLHSKLLWVSRLWEQSITQSMGSFLLKCKAI